MKDNTEAITAEIVKDSSLASMMELMNKNQTQESYKSQYEALTDEFGKIKTAFRKLKIINEEILTLYDELREEYEDLLEDYEEIQYKNDTANTSITKNNQSMQ
jgi:chromosome segregation ATPase